MTSVTYYEDDVAANHVQRMRDHLYGRDDLRNIPEPTWLIDNVLVSASLAVLWGPPGVGKSFVALDWALSVATGLKWFNNGTDAGSVIYSLGEGLAGIRKRVDAWEAYRGCYVDNESFVILGQPVRLLEDIDVRAIVQILKEHQPSPKLFVVDTLARAMLGGSENDSGDMGKVVDACETIRAATGVTVLLVHHATKQSASGAASMRGSGALKGAVDTEYELADDGDVVELRCQKQKDSKRYDATSLAFIQREGSLVVTDLQLVEGERF